jgi:hypothetical protein
MDDTNDANYKFRMSSPVIDRTVQWQRAKAISYVCDLRMETNEEIEADLKTRAKLRESEEAADTEQSLKQLLVALYYERDRVTATLEEFRKAAFADVNAADPMWQSIKYIFEQRAAHPA